jgi:hypothetical protein
MLRKPPQSVIRTVERNIIWKFDNSGIIFQFWFCATPSCEEVVFLSLTSGFPPFFLQKQLMKCWRAFYVAPGWRRYGQPGGRMWENKYLTFALNDFFDGIVLVFSGNGRDEVIV